MRAKGLRILTVPTDQLAGFRPFLLLAPRHLDFGATVEKVGLGVFDCTALLARSPWVACLRCLMETAETCCADSACSGPRHEAITTRAWTGYGVGGGGVEVVPERLSCAR